MIRRSPERRAQARPQRGIALILAMLMIVVMTAMAMEFNYNSYVDNLSSYHYKDDTKSYYLAKSGIRTYGLLLIFARQLSSNSLASGMLSSFGINIDGPDMMCRSLPFLDTAMLRALQNFGGGSLDDEEKSGLMGLMGVGSSDAPKDSAGTVRARGATDELDEEEEGLRRKLLEFEGDFKVDCSDESAKIDLNGFANTRWAALPIEQHPTAQMIYGLMAPPEYDPLFEDRLKLDRWELIGNIRDWVDVDDQRSGIWGGDENSIYNNEEPRYRAKNAAFDSVEELRMVAGVSDEVWATFGSAFSIHTRNFKINVNAADSAMIRALIRAYTDPTLLGDMTLDNEVIPMLMAERMFLPGPFRNSSDFIGRIKSKGIAFASPEAETQLKGLISTDSKVFLLSSTGYVNESTRTIDTVIRVSSNGVSYLAWKER
jgi:type II secretory pathway component PulK